MTRQNKRNVRHPSRREFLFAGLAVPALGALALERSSFALAHPRRTSGFAGAIKLASPDGKVRFELLPGSEHLQYRITLGNDPVIEPSALRLSIDGSEICEGAEPGRMETYRSTATYLSRGVHSLGVNRCSGARISLKHSTSSTRYTLEVRAFNDGVAFRFIVPGTGPRVPDEGTTFTLPAGSTVWFHDFEGHYEGIHKRKEIAEVTTGEWVAPPLTIKLPMGLGYAAITEAALINYAGLGLQADGQRGFKTVLGHALPVSHPFDLRYGKDEAARLSKPAAIKGTITTPWRVVMVGADLNALVNCDVIDDVSPPPDKKIFPAGPSTDWVRPGRAVWKYLDGGENTLDGMKEFSRLASELGFEYNVVEGFWQRWPETQMRELVDYSKQRRVGIWFWKHSKDLRTPEAREKFFSLCNNVGVVGAKIDFFDHEAKEVIDFYQMLLKEAAEHKIMLEFHGANKPTGESRTWPNEMTREAVRGLEYRSTQTRAVHNTTLPFTRFLAGHADYTPLHFGERRRETSWAHQIASAVIFTSPLMIYGAHPRHILDNPAVELIKSIPSVWDETIVMPGSEIGEIAAFARRRGNGWFIGIMNGPNTRSVKLPLGFLARGKYQAMLVRDQPEESGAVKIERATVSKKDLLSVALRSAGGFVARLSL